jgi:hypothetical protein
MTAPNTNPEGQDKPATGWKALLSEEFNWAEAMGGPRGMAESVAPGVVFVVAYVIRPTLWPALVAALAVAVVTAVIRLIQRGSVMGAVSSVGGIALGVVWAAMTSRTEDFFAPGLWINLAYFVGCLVTMLVRYPLVGAVMALLTGHFASFRSNRAYMRRSYWLTLVWVFMFGLRLAIEVPLYLNAQVVLLGTAKLALGFPLFALVLWISWLGMRPVRPARVETTPEAAQ